MWTYPKIIAHRGGGILAPENTLAAMRCGLAHGFHAVEFDVMLSSDAVPILMHDEEFGRTLAGSGSVSAITAADLLRMDAGAWFGPEFSGEPVPAFAEVIAFCKSNRIWMNIEIKPAIGFERQTGTVAAEVVKKLFEREIAEHAAGAPAEILPLLSSFSFEALQAAQCVAPEIPRGYLLDRVPQDWRASLRKLDAISLHTNHLYLSSELTREIKQEGYGVMVYTVNDAQRGRELLGWGVDAFCTDRIDVIGADFGA